MSKLPCTIHLNGDREITIYMHTVSEANHGGKLKDRIRRKSGQKKNTVLTLNAYWRKPPLFKTCVFVLTRYSLNNSIDAHDNLPRALKHVVDGVATWVGLDDGNERINWQYKKEVGDPAVKIEMILNARLETKIVRDGE